MNLSERAKEYLMTLKRDIKWTSNERDIKRYLINQRVYPYEAFLEFELKYSGYELTIRNDPGQSFSAALFSKDHIKKNGNLEIDKVGDRLVQICGAHKTAQFTFFLTDRGELCTLDDEDLPNILHSSFDKFIEEYALRNEISHWDSNPHYFEVLVPERLEAYMSQRFSIVPECTDKFSTWWTYDDIVAVKGVWLDRSEFYFHVYGKNRELCDSFIDELKDNRLLK